MSMKEAGRIDHKVNPFCLQIHAIIISTHIIVGVWSSSVLLGNEVISDNEESWPLIRLRNRMSA